MTGRRNVGRYEVLGQIGRGGMAVVYLARQIDLDRLVALKELNALHASDVRPAQRFLQEARVAGSFSHPNIVTVFDYIEHEGTPFIAMEYLERGSLRPWVGALTLEQIGGVLGDVLAGLVHAERGNVVHRDLKPENIMLTIDGQVKIADFGIAKATSRITAGFQTATGIAVGTPGYMAPEQAMARDLGPWTDLYAVGCMAYELFTGQLPFGDSTEPIALLLRHVNEPVPPAREVQPELDDDISRWIDALLVKQPERRPQYAAAAWESLDEILSAKLGARWRRGAPILTESGTATAKPRRTQVLSAAQVTGRIAPAPAALDAAPSAPAVPGPYTPPPDDLHRAPPLDPDAAADALSGFVSFQLPPPSHPPASDPPTPPPPWLPAAAPTVIPPSPPQSRRAATPAALAPRGGEPQLAPTLPPRHDPAPVSPARERGRRRGVLLAIAALVAVAVSAALLARGDQTPSPRQHAATASPGPELTAGPLQGRLPAGWLRLTDPASVPGLGLRQAVSGAPAGRDTGAVVLGLASSDANTPALLPAAFVRLVAPSGTLPAGRRVAIGGGTLSALRYDRLAPAGYARFLTLFAIPTSAGVTTLVCVPPAAGARAFAARCDEVAASLRVRGARTFDVAPNKDYANALNELIHTVDGATASGLRRMRSAQTAKRQRAAATAISRDYHRAASSQARVEISPADQAANRRIARALNAVASRYRALANATGHTAAERYRTAARSAVAALKDVDSALDALARNGYGRGVDARLRQRPIPAMKPPRRPATPRSTPPPAATATRSSTPGPAATAQPGPATTARPAPAPTARPTPIPERPTPIPDGPGGN